MSFKGCGKGWVCSILCFLASATYAQVPAVLGKAAATQALPRSATRTVVSPALRSPINQAQVSKALSARVEESYTRARQLQAQYPRACKALQSGPAKRMCWDLYWEPSALYPQAPFLKNHKELTQYFLARQNRDMAYLLPKIQQLEETIQARLKDFKNNQAVINHPPHEDMAWLAAQIPDRTRYIFLGELHGYEPVRQQVANFLHELRVRFPKKPIIVLTEFLPEHYRRVRGNMDPLLKMYAPVWDAAYNERMEVFGLEPEFVLENELPMSYSTGKKIAGISTSASQSVWASMEGLRVRNERWLQTIRYYKIFHPDALFVIYAGLGHLEYQAPFSLANSLAGENIFNISLMPNLMPSNKYFKPAADFDYFTQDQFPQRIVQFTDPELRKLAGFDIRMRVDISAQD